MGIVSTKKFEFWIFVGSLLREHSTKICDLLAFVGRILKVGSTKQQELILFVGAAVVFSSYGRSKNRILSGVDTTKTLHRKIQSEASWWRTPLR